MKSAFFSIFKVSFISSLGRRIFVRAMKLIVGVLKVLCLNSECAGQSLIR